MPIYTPGLTPDIPPEQALAAVLDFLSRCEAWAEDRELPKHLARFQAAPLPEHAAKLHQWSTWLAFIHHAQDELRTGELDAWFTPSSPE